MSPEAPDVTARRDTSHVCCDSGRPTPSCSSPGELEGDCCRDSCLWTGVCELFVCFCLLARVFLCAFQGRNLVFVVVFGLSADDLLGFLGSRTVQGNVDVFFCLQQVQNHLRVGCPDKTKSQNKDRSTTIRQHDNIGDTQMSLKERREWVED